MGVPLAMLIFGASSDISMILLPLMFYHSLQIFIHGLLANHWKRRHEIAVSAVGGARAGDAVG